MKKERTPCRIISKKASHIGIKEMRNEGKLYVLPYIIKKNRFEQEFEEESV